MGSVFFAFAQKKKKSNPTNNTTTAADTTKVDYKELGAPMPPLKMRMISGTKVSGNVMTSKDLGQKNYVLVMMYNPTCGHCQEETVLLKKNIHLFNKTSIVLMSDSLMKEYVDFFENTTRVSEIPSIKVGLDYAGFINRTFIYKALPQINVYSPDRKLVKIFTGDVPIDSLKPYIE
ncbi:hypothetical protein CAP35_08265 [Chitinophagaceae bacterium IBVUCB1]|nr:hypothetical protein CAP35_08265 [Chitinophagaceae bacterium IBVUCB1]